MACPYLTGQPKRVDWRLLSLFHVESEHIRVHDLREGDDLKADIEKYRSEHAMAVIIINNEETQILSKKFSSSLEGFNNFLIAVLSASEGSSLYEFLSNDEHEIHARYVPELMCVYNLDSYCSYYPTILVLVLYLNYVLCKINLHLMFP